MAWSSTSRMRMTAPRPFTLPLSLATRLALAPYRVAGTACDWILGKRPEPEQGRRLPGSARSPHAGGQDGDAPRTVPAAQGRRFCARGPRALQFQSFFRADVAQLAEHITRNDGVLGSIPSVGSSLFPAPRAPSSKRLRELATLPGRAMWLPDPTNQGRREAREVRGTGETQGRRTRFAFPRHVPHGRRRATRLCGRRDRPLVERHGAQGRHDCLLY